MVSIVEVLQSHTELALFAEFEIHQEVMVTVLVLLPLSLANLLVTGMFVSLGVDLW